MSERSWFRCPYCVALEANELDAYGVLRLPRAVLPSELCERCRLLHLEMTGRASDVEELEHVLGALELFPQPGQDFLVGEIRARIAQLKAQ